MLAHSSTSFPLYILLHHFRCFFFRLYRQLIRPQLECAVSIWNPYLKRDIEVIKKVQCRATKCICNLKDKSYQDRLSTLGIDTLQQRRSIFDLIEVFKIVHNLSFQQFPDFFLFDTNKITCSHQYNCPNYVFTEIFVNILFLLELLICGIIFLSYCLGFFDFCNLKVF